MRRCIVCGRSLDGRDPRAQTCSPSCRREAARYRRVRRSDALYEWLVQRDTFTDEEKPGLAVFADQYGPNTVEQGLERLIQQCQLTAKSVTGIEPAKPEHAGLLVAQADQLRACEGITRMLASFMRTYHEIVRRTPETGRDEGGRE